MLNMDDYIAAYMRPDFRDLMYIKRDGIVNLMIARTPASTHWQIKHGSPDDNGAYECGYMPPDWQPFKSTTELT